MGECWVKGTNKRYQGTEILTTKEVKATTLVKEARRGNSVIRAQ